MCKKIIIAVFIASFVFLSSEKALSQQRIIKYPSRISSSQNYSYYRYRRVVTSRPVSSVPNGRVILSRPSLPYRFASYANPVPAAQNFYPSQPQVFEEEIREEFRTWNGNSAESMGSGSSEIESLRSEISELRAEVRELSEKISGLSGGTQQSGLKSEDAEKLEKLKKELRELKTLLEEFRKRN